MRWTKSSSRLLGGDAQDDVAGREVCTASHEETARRDDRRRRLTAVVDRSHAFDHDAVRGHDIARGAQDRYILAARSSRETFERLIRAEMERVRLEEAEEADNDGEAPQRVEAGGSRV